MSLPRICQCQTCHADATMTKLPHPVTGATRFVLTCPSLCATRSASEPWEAVARWNAANPAPDKREVARCRCGLRMPCNGCLTGDAIYRRGESVIHDGRKWT
jgi:hypothetical protein